MGDTPQRFAYEGKTYLVSELIEHIKSTGDLGHVEQWTVEAAPVGEAKDFTFRLDHETGKWAIESDEGGMS